MDMLHNTLEPSLVTRPSCQPQTRRVSDPPRPHEAFIKTAKARLNFYEVSFHARIDNGRCARCTRLQFHQRTNGLERSFARRTRTPRGAHARGGDRVSVTWDGLLHELNWPVQSVARLFLAFDSHRPFSSSSSSIQAALATSPASISHAFPLRPAMPFRREVSPSGSRLRFISTTPGC